MHSSAPQSQQLHRQLDDIHTHVEAIREAMVDILLTARGEFRRSIFARLETDALPVWRALDSLTGGAYQADGALLALRDAILDADAEETVLSELESESRQQ